VHHGQLVAGEGSVGEHVHDVVLQRFVQVVARHGLIMPG
jgi:hypothetical protein